MVDVGLRGAGAAGFATKIPVGVGRTFERESSREAALPDKPDGGVHGFPFRDAEAVALRCLFGWTHFDGAK